VDKAQVVVTGASRGIGAAIASNLERRGYPVVGLSRSGECAAGTGIVCDLTDEMAVREVFAGIAASGPVAALVNNAGAHSSSASADLTTDAYRQLMAINATSVMVAAREIYPCLKAAGGGSIINIGSLFDKLGVPANLAYCASKAAVAAMTRCLAVEWARDGIRVLNVAPGYIATDLNREFMANEKVQAFLAKRIPTGGAGKADDVARLVGALIAEGLPYLTGETIYLDGAQGINL
jgi:NAD(P)-dependent dehydrogenase (short-subunit alcohol dehydrogenase family)